MNFAVELFLYELFTPLFNTHDLRQFETTLLYLLLFDKCFLGILGVLDVLDVLDVLGVLDVLDILGVLELTIIIYLNIL